MGKGHFVATYSQHDRYSDDGREMVEFESEHADDYVVFDASMWEALDRPERVIVTITPAGQ